MNNNKQTNKNENDCTHQVTPNNLNSNSFYPGKPKSSNIKLQSENCTTFLSPSISSPILNSIQSKNAQDKNTIATGDNEARTTKWSIKIDKNTSADDAYNLLSTLEATSNTILSPELVKNYISIVTSPKDFKPKYLTILLSRFPQELSPQQVNYIAEKLLGDGEDKYVECLSLLTTIQYFAHQSNFKQEMLPVYEKIFDALLKYSDLDSIATVYRLTISLEHIFEFIGEPFQHFIVNLKSKIIALNFSLDELFSAANWSLDLAEQDKLNAEHFYSDLPSDLRLGVTL